jgi:DNA-binding response OmpR family regulator
MNPTRPERILVITDNPDEGSVVQAILARAGFSVGLVSNQDVTVEQIEAGKPALIVMDTLTPRLADWPILGQLARLTVRPPVVVLSSACLSAGVLGILNAAAAEHFAKPITAEVLVGRCERLLASRLAR